MERTLYSTETLIGVISHLKPLPKFWGRFFPNTFRATTEYIVFSELFDNRFLAPFVLPTEQGRPTYGRLEQLQSFRPAYVKPKDSTQDHNMLARAPGFGEIGALNPMSAEQRYDALVADILRHHRSIIENREEWLAAQALIYGKVTIESPDYPTQLVDFRRDAGQTVALTGNARWGVTNSSGSLTERYKDSGTRSPNPMDDIDKWVWTMSQAKRGGVPQRIIMGRNAYKAFISYPQVEKQLDKDLRVLKESTLDIGITSGQNYEYKGRLSDNLEVWVYSDYYEEEDGTRKEFFPSDDILFIGGSVEGAMVYGVILDKKARFQALRFFPKMWDEEDPSNTVIMTQSAPLAVPMRANATFRVTVNATA